MHSKTATTTTALAVAAGLVLAGCGGGPSVSGVVLTGRVVSRQNTSQGVAGATVTVATYSGTSDSTGRFRIVMAENVVDPTFRIAAPTGFYSQAVYYNSLYVRATEIPTPLPLYNGKDLGVIELHDLNSGPPPPPP